MAKQGRSKNPFKPLTIPMILKWADSHHRRTGEWPITRSGPIFEQPDRTWEGVASALVKGLCGMKGGDSLHRLLTRERKIVDARRKVPELTKAQILRWADNHRRETGLWPWRECGEVIDCPEITWGSVDRRMRAGEFGLKKGTSIATLLEKERDVYFGGKPVLSEALVLQWANEHFKKFKRWPVTKSGWLHNHPEENWAAIDVGMRNARRGFPRKDSLSRLLRRTYGKKYDVGVPALKSAVQVKKKKKAKKR